VVVAPQPAAEIAKSTTLKLSILRMFAGIPGAMQSRSSPTGRLRPEILDQRAEVQKWADVLAADAKAQSFRRGPTGREKARLHTPSEGRLSSFDFHVRFSLREHRATEQEARDVGIFLDDFVDWATAGVSGLRVVEKRDRTVRAGGGLQPRLGAARANHGEIFEGAGRADKARRRDFPLWQFAKRTVSLNNRQKRAPQ